MVLADRGRGLVQEIAAHVGDAGVDLLDAGLGFFPVVAELHFARHGPLIAGESYLVFPEGVGRFDVAAVAQSGEACDSYVDTDNGRRRVYWQLDVALGLDRREPLAAVTRYRDVLRRAEDVPAVAVANPAEFGRKTRLLPCSILNCFGSG